jgi:primase-polymerase (primpol)-like protein
MNKPEAIKFFWNGLATLSGKKRLVEDFKIFSQNPNMQTLSIVYEAIKHEIIKYCHEKDGTEDLIYQVIEGYEYGAKKHGETDYLNAKLEDIINAIGRHLIQFLLGTGVDQESGLHHLALIMCNILIAAELFNFRV